MTDPRSASDVAGRGTAPHTHERLVLAAALVSAGVWLPIIPGAWVLPMLGACLALVTMRTQGGGREFSPRGIDVAFTFLCFGAVAFGGISTVVLLVSSRDPASMSILVPVAAFEAAVAAVVVVAARDGQVRVRRVAFAVLVVVYVIVVMWSNPPIDVIQSERATMHELLAGRNPYAATLPNYYTPEQTKELLSPGFVSADGSRLLFGFVYPPLAMVLLIPGHLLGDPRWALAIALVVAWWATRRLGATDRVSPVVWTAPILLMAFFVVGLGWTEPMTLAALALLVLASRREHWSVPIWLALVFGTKQYLIVLLPLVWLLMPHWRRLRGGVAGTIGAAAAICVVSVLPFAIADFGALWRSLVVFHVEQPFRLDAKTVFADLSTLFGGEPPAVVLLLGLVSATALAVALAATWPRTPESFAVASGVVLTVLFVFSKQAFTNYYFLAAGALLLGALAWRSAGHWPGRGAESREGEAPAIGPE